MRERVRSDMFGIGQAIRGAALVYFTSSRGSGRTISMVESVKDGDRLVFATAKEARRVDRLCKERNVRVECVVVPPSNPQEVMGRGTAQGRTIFDHSWIEQYYLAGIDRLGKDISYLEEQCSGEGEARRATRRCAAEAFKWGS
jgi:hypothetical protein